MPGVFQLRKTPDGELLARPLDNPFIDIPNVARFIIVVYFIFWRILPELAGTLQLDTPDKGIVVARFFARLLLETLLLLPFLLRRFAGTPIGWLHPLILPGLMAIAKEIVTDPFTLLSVATAWLSAPQIPDYRIMSGMPLEVLLSVELKRDALAVFAQIAFMLGFAAYSRRARPMRLKGRVSVSSFRMNLVVGVCFGVFVSFIQLNGGFIEHFSTLAYGRFLMSHSAGHILVIIALLPYLMILWYVVQPWNLQRPWFIALLIGALFAQFATTGSRSSLIVPIILILAAWMLINRRTPMLGVALLGLFIVLFLGILGDLRSSALRSGGVVDFSILTQMDFSTALERTVEHREKNTEVSGQIAVMHAVPERVPHLYGRTYIASLAFFIPRTIWPDKPRGPGAHVGALIYAGRSTTAGYTGGGIPPGGVGEAYWNFGVPGVPIVYFVFGLFLRLVTHSFLSRPQDPWRTVVFLMAMLTLGDPNSDAIVSFLQAIVLLMVAWLFVRRTSAQTARVTLCQQGSPMLASGLRYVSPRPVHGRFARLRR